MTVATKEPETESVQSKAAQEQAASLERALRQPTAVSNGKQHHRKAKQSRRVTTLYVVIGVVAVIAALGLAGRHAAQVGSCQLFQHVTFQ